MSPLLGAREQFVSPPAVLQRIHQADGFRSRRQARSDEEIRTALALVVAVAEQTHLSAAAEVVSPHSLELSWEELERRTGLSRGSLQEALSLLGRAEVLHLSDSTRERVRVRLFPEVVDAQPGLARLHWEKARGALLQQGASLAPALAVLREVAQDSGIWPESEAAPWVEVTYEKLTSTTFFSRSSVAASLAALEEAGLLEKGEKRSRRSVYRLGPVALGGEGPSCSQGMAPLAVPGGSSAISAERASPTPQRTAGALILQIGGVRLHLPAGTECELVPDQSGTPVLRILS